MTAGRCALILSTFRPVTGGYQRQLEAVFAALQRDHQWHVGVVTRSQHGSPRHELVEGLPVRRAGTNGPTFAAAAAAWLGSFRPDVLVTAQLGSAAVAAVSFGSLTRRPVVVRLAGSEDLDSAAARFVAATAARTVLVAPSRHQLDAVEWPLPKVVMPNGVRVLDAPAGQAALWYGRDTRAKNPEDFAELVAANPDVPFIALGDAALPDRSNLLQRGWVADAADALVDASVFVSTSRSEGSPNVALQAIGMGRPVVAFENAAYSELAAQYPGYVHVVPFGDVTAMATALRAAMASGVPVPAGVPTVAQAAARWDRLLRGIA